MSPDDIRRRDLRMEVLRHGYSSDIAQKVVDLLLGRKDYSGIGYGWTDHEDANGASYLLWDRDANED